MGITVRVIPLSAREMRTAFLLVERVTWELGDSEIQGLTDLGLQRRRVFVLRDAAGAWLLDVMEGDSDLVGVVPEAVWATSGCALDRWIAARQLTSSVGDPAFLPEMAPSLDLRFTRDEMTATDLPAAIAPRLVTSRAGQLS